MDVIQQPVQPAPVGIGESPLEGLVLVQCALCEEDWTLVMTHGAADRLLVDHLGACPGPQAGTAASARPLGVFGEPPS